MFGGEFSNPNGEKFRHFNDLWRYDLGTNEWEEQTAPQRMGRPSPRSGHRMAVWRNRYIVLFGGFYDTYSQTNYFNDVWVWDIIESMWQELTFLARSYMPAPRSGCQLLMDVDNSAYVVGGYTKTQKSSGFVAGGKKGRRTYEEEDVDPSEGVTHGDVWRLELSMISDGADGSTERINPNAKWERLKQKGRVPDARCSFAMPVYVLKRRAIMFGGVMDGVGWDSGSVFLNDLHSFDMAQQQWFGMKMKWKKDVEQIAIPPRFGAQCAIVGHLLFMYAVVSVGPCIV